MGDGGVGRGVAFPASGRRAVILHVLHSPPRSRALRQHDDYFRDLTRVVRAHTYMS